VPLAGSTPPGVINRPDQPRSTSTTTSPVDPLSRTVPDPPQARTQATHRPQRSAQPPRQAPVRHSSSGGGGSISRPVLAAIIVGVLVIIALGGWGLSQLGGGDDNGTNPKAGTKTSPATKAATEKLPVSKVLAYNRGPHADSSANSDLGKATDDNKSSYWTTQHYNGADFGRLRSGIGLVLDMGKTVSVSNVKVSMPPGTPGTVELHIGDSPTSGTQQTDTGDAVGSFTLNGKQAKGRYVTLYFTKLPNIGEFKARVQNVAVYGTG
jgi:hypothetical protein